MSNRCPGCNMFAGLELEEPDLNDVTIDQDNGEITLDVRVFLISACCGEEMKEFNFNDDGITIDGLEEHIEAHKAAGEDYFLEADAEVETTERVQTHAVNRKTGKRTLITNPRWSKTYRGYHADITVQCSCEKQFEGEYDNDEQASSFDDLN